MSIHAGTRPRADSGAGVRRSRTATVRRRHPCSASPRPRPVAAHGTNHARNMPPRSTPSAPWDQRACSAPSCATPRSPCFNSPNRFAPLIPSAPTRRCSKESTSLRKLVRDDRADARVQHDLLAALVQYGDAQQSTNVANSRAAYREAQGIAQALNVTRDAQTEHDLAIVTQRLVDAPFRLRNVQPELWRFANGTSGLRLLWMSAFPAAVTHLAVGADTPKGWSRACHWCLVRTAGLLILDDRELQRVQSILAIAGPPPAETILLLAVPQASARRSEQGLRPTLRPYLVLVRLTTTWSGWSE